MEEQNTQRPSDLELISCGKKYSWKTSSQNKNKPDQQQQISRKAEIQPSEYNRSQQVSTKLPNDLNKTLHLRIRLGGLNKAGKREAK